MPKTKKDEFHKEMLSIFDKANTECNYKPIRFVKMVATHGGFQAAKILVNIKELSEGFTVLWEAKRLDLTVEALILKDEWKDLFTDDDLKNARKKLKDYGYIP